MKPIWHDNDNGVRETDLQGYVDGLLDGQQRTVVEAYLATSPVEAERLAAYRRQNIALHALFDSTAGEDLAQLPTAMTRLARALDAELITPSRPAAPPSRDYRRLAACLALLAAGAAGWAALDGGGWRDTAPDALQPAALPTPAPVSEGATATPIRSDESVPPAVAPEVAPEVDPAIETNPPVPPIEAGKTPQET